MGSSIRVVGVHYMEFSFFFSSSSSFSRPMVTGTSVLGVTFADGVMLAADTLGKFARYCSCMIFKAGQPCT